ncbi:hypothetical protein QUF80_07870 [Desulfococcaceae bacterium HSG8]|nr:hypothetical protein [Desulfococcaceae bacterium HSG8]
MKLPWGTLTPLVEKSGLPPQYLSDLVATRKRPGRKRAKFLEEATKEIGREVPVLLWLYGSSVEIKSALMNEG